MVVSYGVFWCLWTFHVEVAQGMSKAYVISVIQERTRGGKRGKPESSPQRKSYVRFLSGESNLLSQNFRSRPGPSKKSLGRSSGSVGGDLILILILTWCTEYSDNVHGVIECKVLHLVCHTVIARTLLFGESLSHRSVSWSKSDSHLHCSQP